MDQVALFFRETVPGYLASLPIPTTPQGFLTLNQDEWIQLAPLLIVVFFHVFMVTRFFLGLIFGRSSSGIINQKIRKNEPKVVDFTEQDGKKKVFCRCWKSAKFPYCDGAHAKHNKDTGDNIGPLIVQEKE